MCVYVRVTLNQFINIISFQLSHSTYPPSNITLWHTLHIFPFKCNVPPQCDWLLACRWPHPIGPSKRLLITAESRTIGVYWNYSSNNHASEDSGNSLSQPSRLVVNPTVFVEGGILAGNSRAGNQVANLLPFPEQGATCPWSSVFQSQKLFKFWELQLPEFSNQYVSWGILGLKSTYLKVVEVEKQSFRTSRLRPAFLLKRKFIC